MSNGAAVEKHGNVPIFSTSNRHVDWRSIKICLLLVLIGAERLAPLVIEQINASTVIILLKNGHFHHFLL